MNEREKTGIAEKLTIQALLWLEDHIEEDLTRHHNPKRKKVATGAVAFAGIAALGVGLTLLKPWEEKPLELPPLDKTIPVARYYEALEGEIQFIKTVGFMQQAAGVNLDLNDKAFKDWLASTGEVRNVAFGIVFKNSDDFPRSIYSLNFQIPIDQRWQIHALGKNKKELMTSLSLDLSSLVTLSVDLVHQYGFWEALEILTSPDSERRQLGEDLLKKYKEKFRRGEIELFIVARDVPDKWIENKLGEK